jgi:hypothetical protein
MISRNSNYFTKVVWELVSKLIKVYLVIYITLWINNKILLINILIIINKRLLMIKCK